MKIIKKIFFVFVLGLMSLFLFDIKGKTVAEYQNELNDKPIKEIYERIFLDSNNLHFYQKLKEEEKKIYDKLILFFKERKPITEKFVFEGNENITLEALSKRTSKATTAFLDDHPEVFWTNGYKINMQMVGNSYKITIEFKLREIFALDNALVDSQIKEIVPKILALRDDAIKEPRNYLRTKFVHDRITLNNKYNKNYDIQNADVQSMSHTLNSCFLESFDPVCEGYAKAYYLLMNMIGIKTIMGTGLTNTNEPHAWNYTQMGIPSKWYFVDLTWDDDDVHNTVVYNYFLKKKPTDRTPDPDNLLPEISETDYLDNGFDYVDNGEDRLVIYERDSVVPIVKEKADGDFLEIINSLPTKKHANEVFVGWYVRNRLVYVNDLHELKGLLVIEPHYVVPEFSFLNALKSGDKYIVAKKKAAQVMMLITDSQTGDIEVLSEGFSPEFKSGELGDYLVTTVIKSRHSTDTLSFNFKFTIVEVIPNVINIFGSGGEILKTLVNITAEDILSEPFTIKENEIFVGYKIVDLPNGFITNETVLSGEVDIHGVYERVKISIQDATKISDNNFKVNSKGASDLKVQLEESLKGLLEVKEVNTPEDLKNGKTGVYDVSVVVASKYSSDSKTLKLAVQVGELTTPSYNKTILGITFGVAGACLLLIILLSVIPNRKKAKRNRYDER